MSILSFFAAFLVFVSIQALANPQTKLESAAAATITLAALYVMMGNFAMWVGWIDWSFWVATIAVWIWFLIMLAVSKPGEPKPDPFAIFRRK